MKFSFYPKFILKAKVPIGVVAATSQSPIVMHLEYDQPILLPDHKWFIPGHSLIPSVYAFMDILPGKLGDARAVTYSGPTYVAIRSSKHSSSNALTHKNDFDSIMMNPNFNEFCRTKTEEVKPVGIIISDGGPDMNPRYSKVKNAAIQHFKDYNLDAIFLATNAPGRSAFNRVERRMAPFSAALAGVLLPHDFYGDHLKTKDKQNKETLEKKNFCHAGTVLAEIWGEMTLDGHKVHAEYIDPDNEVFEEPIIETQEWLMKHTREGHYFYQVSC